MIRTWLGGMAIALLIGGPALGEPRVALVIGNGSYDAKIGALSNPVNDARSVGDALRKAGFDVDIQTNLDQKGMKRAISRLGERLRAAGSGATGLFYYGGHGMQSRGENYLVPVGAAIQSEADIDIEAVPAAGVLSQMEDVSGGVNIIILDACRNTPGVRKTRGSATRGLARMDAPKGSFIAYSTAPGEVAEDGTGGHSPFAQALAERIRTPAPIDKLFIDVRRNVLAATGQRQTPWTSSSLVDEFYFVPPSASATTAARTQPSAPATAPDARTIEMEFWKSVSDSNDIAQLQDYIDRFPAGTFVNIARSKIAALKAKPQPQQVAVASPAPRTVAPSSYTMEDLRRSLSNVSAAENRARQAAQQAHAQSRDQDVLKKKGGNYQIDLFAAITNAAKANVANGLGVKNLKNGDTYAGELRNGLSDGFGQMQGGNASPIREALGQFSNGALNGFAAVLYKDGTISKGTWKNDQMSGFGVRFDIGGHAVEQGYYENGTLLTPIR